MIQKLMGHIVTLPRWFGLPAAVCGVVLGGLIAGANAFHLLFAVLCGVFLLAYAHSANSWIDWAITKLDQGEPKERSKQKVYTSGQSLLALGMLSQNEVLANSLGWLALSLGFAIPLSLMTTMWVWLPFGLVVLCAPAYSWGKLHYSCELILGLGFGSFATMMGACAVANPPLWVAFLAGLPFTLLWGYFAETYDQWDDADVNWDKGLRNLGAWVWKSGLSISHFLGWLLALTYLAQVFLIANDILAPMTAISALAIPVFAYSLAILQAEKKKGVLIVLLAIFLQMILLTVGQGIGG